VGGVHAYKGLASLPLKVRYVRGSKVKNQRRRRTALT